MTILNTLAFVVYLILIILPAVFKAGKARLMLYLCLIPLSALAALFFPQCAWLLPLLIARIPALDRLPFIVQLIVYLLPLCLLKVEIYPLYLLYAVLSFTVFKTVVSYEKRAMAREQKIDRLEAANQALNLQIGRWEAADREKGLLIKLEERNRIAQKLHDDLGHTITGSLMQLEAVNALIHDDPQKAQTMIARVTAVLNSGMYALRQQLKSLKPLSEELGIQSIKSLLGEFEITGKLHTRLETAGDLLLISPARWQVIVVNLKEALTNILKHSAADEVYTAIEVFNKVIKVSIRDNGRGAPNIVPGMGLNGIEERTRSAGGALITDGSKGFSLIMIYKISSDSAHHDCK